jgi:hypothetical protein
MSAEEVLTAFRHNAPYLFLGAAFAAVGMVSAAFAVLGRQRDPLLICFALFAALYGLRLWISLPILAMMAQGATFYARLRGAVNHVTLIPAFHAARNCTQRIILQYPENVAAIRFASLLLIRAFYDGEEANAAVAGV